MPLIIEDGTMPAGANSYVSLESADNYLVPRGLWPVTERKKDDTTDGTTTEPVEPDEESTDNNEQSEVIDIENPEETQPELPDTSKPDDDPEIAKKEISLMRAFDYLNTLKWKGQRVCWQRQVAWPRKNVPVPGSNCVCGSNNQEFIADNIVPDAVKKAQMELAALIYNGVDMFKPLERGGQYQSQSDSFTKSVDVISKSESHSIAYANNAPKDTWLPSVYPLLRDFLDEIPGQSNGFTVHNILRG